MTATFNRGGQEWIVVATFPDTFSAALIQGLLESEGVPAELRSDMPFLGEGRSCAVYVPDHLLHQAKRILDEDPPSDSELNFLATGQP